MIRNLFVAGILLLLVGACSSPKQSIPVEYQKVSIDNIQPNGLISVGVLKWEDNRKFTQAKDQWTERAIWQYGGNVTGLTNNGIQFVRIADLVRDVYIQELKSLGMNVHLSAIGLSF